MSRRRKKKNEVIDRRMHLASQISRRRVTFLHRTLHKSVDSVGIAVGGTDVYLFIFTEEGVKDLRSVFCRFHHDHRLNFTKTDGAHVEAGINREKELRINMLENRFKIPPPSKPLCWE